MLDPNLVIKYSETPVNEITTESLKNIWYWPFFGQNKIPPAGC